ncbi:hypothetical protein [Pseudorhodoplanes sinuspersici]|uniref:Uncharacterized protein n=1 Tax=Pseudorhodoplanes sinuspersici TaxID=1235591 RepID=A0A1W6ZXJ8_9HYPH|nr:hypothetical protein [Pseudorhodoplanes sinuspersici]ARQ02117.1 hypothetical protein CAK95_25725 [Pseudorhodoplanes sinuspersici]RKE73921.1 hypothetical protein DFP91_1819 [Pseudorhodoplanes sinuspersici]
MLLRVVGVVSLALVVGNCGGADSGAMLSSGAPANPANAAENARLALIDRCMTDTSSNVSVDPKKGKAPYCQCYAKTVVQGLSPQQQASLASNGSMPWSVDSAAISRSCSRA